MRPTAMRAFRALAADAVQDGVRRRIVPLVAALSIASLMVVDRCASCTGATAIHDGRSLDPSNLAGWSALLIFVALGLWTAVLAGLVAADHLTEPLSDGSFALCLARPVGRGTYALARLGGVLVLAWGAGAVLLGGSALLIGARHGLPLLPALWAFLACALGCVCVAALAMTASLALPRAGTALVVVLGVGAVGWANAASLLGAELSPVSAALDRFGPPLCSAMAVALGPWIGPAQPPAQLAALAGRLLLWAGASALLLRAAVGRLELR